MPKFHSAQSSSRRLRRFYSPSPIPAPGNTIEIAGREFRHLRASLRLEAGDRCLLTDGRGYEAEARIESLFPRKACLQVERILKREGRNGKCGLDLSVYLALPQKGKMDFIVEKAQELGVRELHPIETERTRVKMNAEARDRAVGRWRQIAIEAAKQSGSVTLVNIEPPLFFERAFAEIRGDHLKIIFHPSADAVPFGKLLAVISRSKATRNLEISPPFGRRNDNGIKPSPAYDLFFGPEGGFTEKEIAFAISSGAQKVGLGENILKIDTAFLSVVSTLRLLFP